MTGHVTLFPNTVDAALFDDPRDPEVNEMMAAIPKDRGGQAPGAARIFGSLPIAPAADPAHAFDGVTIPGLGADLNAAYAVYLAQSHGKPDPSAAARHSALWIGFNIAGLIVFSTLLLRRLAVRRKQRDS
jgi:hypothetical protein